MKPLNVKAQRQIQLHPTPFLFSIISLCLLYTFPTPIASLIPPFRRAGLDLTLLISCGQTLSYHCKNYQNNSLGGMHPAPNPKE